MKNTVRFGGIYEVRDFGRTRLIDYSMKPITQLSLNLEIAESIRQKISTMPQELSVTEQELK